MKEIVYLVKKNVDENFKIVEKLDKNKYEIWYMSYNGKPKSWYKVDKFLSKIPYEKVGSIYEKCDILIKSIIIDSFSYPPLEMMATGGFSIVAPNEGNIDSAIKCFERLVSDIKLQNYLYENGLDTAKKRDWKNLKNQILFLYEQ